MPDYRHWLVNLVYGKPSPMVTAEDPGNFSPVDAKPEFCDIPSCPAEPSVYRRQVSPLTHFHGACNSISTLALAW